MPNWIGNPWDRPDLGWKEARKVLQAQKTTPRINGVPLTMDGVKIDNLVQNHPGIYHLAGEKKNKKPNRH